MISSDRITLRAIRSSDIEELKCIRTDIEFRNNVMMHPFPITELQEEDWMNNVLNDKNNSSVYLAISEVDKDKTIGLISFTNVSYIHQRADLGIYLSKGTRGKGVGKEATELMLQYGFDSLNFHKIELKVLEFNEVALNMYEQLGFEKTALLKDHFYCSGKFQNVVYMTIYSKNSY